MEQSETLFGIGEHVVVKPSPTLHHLARAHAGLLPSGHCGFISQSIFLFLSYVSVTDLSLFLSLLSFSLSFPLYYVSLFLAHSKSYSSTL